ncbi:MAG TPA: DNA helicase RecG, partial [Actinobacteria bacterium]|nr:DNA helicase RecG [Actinomycetota bacterium]
MSAPRSLAYLSAVPVERVKGIGPKRAARLAEAGVASVADLLLHVPRRYIDRSRRYELATAPLGEEITVWGRVESVVRRRISRNRTMITARISDGTTTLEAVWFWPRLRIEEGWDVALSGKLERRRGKLRMTSPDLDPIGEDAVKTGRIVPVHAKVAGLGPYLLRAAIANALKRSRPIADPIPGDVLAAVGLVDRDRAFAQVHFPDTAEDASRARRRLAFDEFFRLELALALRRRHRRREAKGIAHRSRRRLVDRYLGSLPYELTGAQRRALAEI